jgi:nucleoside-diphosphate-sugar epimerase
VLAPGPSENPLQYIDARDLAAFAIDTALRGAVNVLSVPGYTTMAELLALCVDVTGSDATLTSVDPQFLLARDVAPWVELPIWVPPMGDLAWFYMTDASLAHRSGLVCRPVRDTVGDTWSWLSAHPDWTQVVAANRTRVGIDPEREAELLAAWADQPPASR